MPYVDKKKKLEYKKRWNKEFYLKNKETEKARIRKRKAGITEWLNIYKSKCACKCCGEKTTVCLDFHHIERNSKDLSIALTRKWGWGIKRIEKEISKCIIVCANCHRKIHAGLIKV